MSEIEDSKQNNLDYSRSKSNLSESKVAGNQSGRDNNITNNITNNIINHPPESTMSSLYKELEVENSENKSLKNKVNDLEYYLTEAQYNVGRTLEEKLIDGGRQSDVKLATIQKERANKKLHRHSTKISAQKIYVFILSKLHNDFRTYISPLIEQDYDKSMVEERISDKVIEPMIEFLESNKLELNHDDIRGLIYLLTGNCHLEWTVYADLSSDI